MNVKKTKKRVLKNARKKVTKNKSDEVFLTENDKIFIDKNWHEMDLLEMVRRIFKNDKLDGRCKEGVAVRKYLTSKGYEYITTKHEKREEINFTTDQKEFILNHAKNGMKPVHITRVLFSDENIHSVSAECMAVIKVIKETNPALLEDSDLTAEEYSPPKSFSKAIRKINAVANQRLQEGKLNLREQKQVDTLIGYMHNKRFIQTINTMSKVNERELFESQFIAQVWDKIDLTVEELNLYINLCNEYIIQNRTNQTVDKLNRILEDITDDRDGKISMSLSDAIKGKTQEYNESVRRQKELVKDLSGRRSDRTKLKIESNRSIVTLVEAMQQRDERTKMLELAEMRKKAMAEELKQMESLEEFTVRIFGVDEEEILN